jgi:hypothetical protein
MMGIRASRCRILFPRISTLTCRNARKNPTMVPMMPTTTPRTSVFRMTLRLLDVEKRREKTAQPSPEIAVRRTLYSG